MRCPIWAAGLLLGALASPVPALDFHPLESRELMGGHYRFDQFIIPQGVTVTLVGEPRTLDLEIAEYLRLDGDLVFGEGWSVNVLVHGTVDWHGDAGPLPDPAILHLSPPLDARRPLPQALGILAGGPPETPGLTSAVPEPTTWLLLLAGLGLVYLIVTREHQYREKQRRLRAPTRLAPSDPGGKSGFHPEGRELSQSGQDA